MVNSFELEPSQSDVPETKPVYQRPVLTELDAAESAGGLIFGAPENSTYS
jgi:hypothetical protein